MSKRVVVLISGSGSNLQAIIDTCAKADVNADVVAVISNRPGVKGLERAAAAGIKALTLDHTGFTSREDFDVALATLIDEQAPDLIILAGFMRILTPVFTARYEGRMMNIHPSLLPKYPGLHTHRRALEAGDTEHGATVHFVTSELDGGPAIIQAKIPVLPGDDESKLASRVLAQEHKIYPQAVKWFVEGKLKYEQGKAWLDGKPLPLGGIMI